MTLQLCDEYPLGNAEHGDQTDVTAALKVGPGSTFCIVRQPPFRSLPCRDQYHCGKHVGHLRLSG